jgi:hypothetical protein
MQLNAKNTNDRLTLRVEQGFMGGTERVRHAVDMEDEAMMDVGALVGGIVVVEASPIVCQNLLGKSCVLPTSKKLCKVKKEFISNRLA